MSKDKIVYAFSHPRFPTLTIVDNKVYGSRSADDLRRLVAHYADNPRAVPTIIDSRAMQYQFLSESAVIVMQFPARRWTKKDIILTCAELDDRIRTKYSRRNLSNVSVPDLLSGIVAEIGYPV